MNRTSTDTIPKKSKSERLGWKSYSSGVAVEMRNVARNGIKVEKNTYCNPFANYRKLIP